MSRRARGYTLVEIVAASSGASIVLAGTVAAMMFGAQAVDQTLLAPAKERQAVETALRILSDSRSATELDTAAASSVGIALRRDSDAADVERVTYSWSGVTGEPVTAQMATLDSTAARLSLWGSSVLQSNSLTEVAAIGLDATAQPSTAVDAFTVLRREAGAAGGYATHPTARFAQQLLVTSGGVSQGGDNVGGGGRYDGFEIRIVGADDRFASRPVAAFSGPASATVLTASTRRVAVALAHEVDEPSTIGINLDVTETWSVQYAVSWQGAVIAAGTVSGPPYATQAKKGGK